MGNVSIITGAAGLIGSHIAEELCRQGTPVRALVRESSNTQFLSSLPIEVVVADLSNLDKTPEALRDAGTIYHCAAFVRDWGTWQEFYDGTVELTKRVVRACRAAHAGRFVHVSSISVYGNPPESAGQITEETPIDKYLWPGDFYGKSKVLAEQEVQSYRDHAIVRPSWVYGRRDLVSLPRVIDALRRRKVKLIGSGDNLMNLVSARDVARGIILAATSPQVRGSIYHLCNRGEITQREFFELISARMELPPVKSRVPFKLAWNVARMLEFLYRNVGANSPPPVTRRALLLLSRPTRFSIEKADRELNWRPEVPVREGLNDVLDWLTAVARDAASATNRAAG